MHARLSFLAGSWGPRVRFIENWGAAAADSSLGFYARVADSRFPLPPDLRRVPGAVFHVKHSVVEPRSLKGTHGEEQVQPANSCPRS